MICHSDDGVITILTGSSPRKRTGEESNSSGSKHARTLYEETKHIAGWSETNQGAPPAGVYMPASNVHAEAWLTSRSRIPSADANVSSSYMPSFWTHHPEAINPLIQPTYPNFQGIPEPQPTFNPPSAHVRDPPALEAMRDNRWAASAAAQAMYFQNPLLLQHHMAQTQQHLMLLSGANAPQNLGQSRQPPFGPFAQSMPTAVMSPFSRSGFLQPEHLHQQTHTSLPGPTTPFARIISQESSLATTVVSRPHMPLQSQLEALQSMQFPVPYSQMQFPPPLGTLPLGAAAHRPYEHTQLLQPTQSSFPHPLTAISQQSSLQPFPRTESRTAPPDETPEGGSAPGAKPSTVGQRSATVRWTRQEHAAFLEGLERFGVGQWCNISKHCVPTRNPAQVASHHQKFVIRSNLPRDKKQKSSLLDTTTAAVQRLVTGLGGAEAKPRDQAGSNTSSSSEEEAGSAAADENEEDHSDLGSEAAQGREERGLEASKSTAEKEDSSGK